MNVSDFPLYRYRATVDRAIDGDTFQVMLSYGDHTYRMRRIRILGYNSPEMVGTERPAGIRAKNALEAITPVGSMVYIETQLDRTNFDRLLGTCYVMGNDNNLYDVADLMISGGFGVRGRTIVFSPLARG